MLPQETKAANLLRHQLSQAMADNEAVRQRLLEVEAKAADAALKSEEDRLRANVAETRLSAIVAERDLAAAQAAASDAAALYATRKLQRVEAGVEADRKTVRLPNV